MNIFAGILGYLAAVGVLVGVAIFGVAALLQVPPDTAKSAAKSPPPLVRAADRKPSDVFRGKAAPATASDRDQSRGARHHRQPPARRKRTNLSPRQSRPRSPNRNRKTAQASVRPTRDFEERDGARFRGSASRFRLAVFPLETTTRT